MGTVALATTNGLTIVSGNPSGDSDIEFTGTASNIDAALNGLTYTPSTGIGGEATLSVSASDQGDGGADAAQSASGEVSIVIGGPMINVPGSQETGTSEPAAALSARDSACQQSS
jgi:hypothetical protein